MLRTFDGSTMTEVPSGSFSDNIDNPPPLALSAFAAHHSSLLPDPPRRRQRRSCDACRRGKRACDAEKCANFENQTCSNCLRKNQACTFNWLKTANESQQDRDRKRRRSSAQNSETSTDGSTIQSNASHHAAQVESTAKEARCARGDQKTRWISSSDEEEEQEDGSNTTSADDADTEANGLVSFDELRSRKSSGRGLVPSSRSQKFPFGTRAYERSPAGEVPLQIKEIFLGERSSRGFVTNGLLRIYNDSMENALSCWLTEHNCPYTLQKYKPSILSAGKADKEWGSSWGNRMYNRVIQLDRAYNALRIRALTAEEERTVSKALKMAVVAFASQWAQAGERGTGFRTGDSNFTTDDFPESNYFERSMQESLWHQTSQILHRAAGIDSFRVVFAMIIFSLTQRPLDISRPFPHTTSKLKSQYEYFKNLIQDDDAPIFLEIALRQMLAQRRTLERAEQEMPKLPNGEPQDPLRPEDRDTFNLLYWLGVMFDTLSAAICQRTVVVNDEDCELPRSESQRLIQSPTLSIDPTVCDDPLMDDSTISANIGEMRSPQDHKVWGDLFMHDIESQADPQAARWPCSYKLAASTLSSAAPVKVLLYRRVAQLQALISRKASASKIEASINAAFHVYNHWNRNYNPFITDCVKHHATLPTRVQSWYILLAGHWHLGVFLLSDLLSTIDETRISLPNERACRQVSNLVTTLRKQNAYAVADLALASIHSAQGEVAEEFHFALNQAALLTEPWTIVFVRSLCRAGHILVQTAAMDPSEQERSQAATRCADCIEGLWYLGRKSDMAFLAARCLSSMLDEARREAAALSSATAAMTTMTTATTTNTSEDEASDDILTAASCHFDDESTPRDAVEPLDFPQPPSTTTTTTSTSTINTNNINNANPTAPIDCTSFFQPWSVADIMSGGGTGCQVAAAAAAAGTDQMPPLTDCDILDFQTPLGMDPSLWDFGLQS